MPLFDRRLSTPLLALWAFSVSFLGLPSLAQAPPPTVPAPVLELGESSVSVRLGAPGGAVVLFGFAHRERHFITTLLRYEEILEDRDGDGVVGIDLGEALPPASLWVGVDRVSGSSAIAAPPGFTLREISLPKGWIPETLDRLDLALSMAEVLLVRPSVGAWGLRVGDGGASDEDGAADGGIRAALAAMWSLGDSPLPPERLQPGDVVVVIDTQNLQIAVVRLAA